MHAIRTWYRIDKISIDEELVILDGRYFEQGAVVAITWVKITHLLYIEEIKNVDFRLSCGYNWVNYIYA
jgi:hypothetical protein